MTTNNTVAWQLFAFNALMIVSFIQAIVAIKHRSIAAIIPFITLVIVTVLFYHSHF